jgi:hypothetical protein
MLVRTQASKSTLDFARDLSYSYDQGQCRIDIVASSRA